METMEAQSSSTNPAINVASNLPNAQLSGELLFNCVIANEPNRLIETLATARNGLEYKDRFANTPLLVAAYLGHANCVRILLQYGANYKRINCYGQNSLSLAAYSGDQLTCEELLRVWPYKHYNKTSMLTPLCVATMREHIGLVRFFLTMDIVSSKRAKCKTATVHGICPLTIAKDKENYEIVELLTEVHKLHI